MDEDDFELPILPRIDKGPPPDCPICGDPMSFIDGDWACVDCNGELEQAAELPIRPWEDLSARLAQAHGQGLGTTLAGAVAGAEIFFFLQQTRGVDIQSFHVSISVFSAGCEPMGGSGYSRTP